MHAVAILMYHQITPSPLPNYRKYGITPEVFGAQVNWLSRAGYQSIDFNDLLGWRQSNKSLPAKAVLFTFDDGYAELLEHAAPPLQAAGFTAVFYLVAGRMGARTEWMHDAGVDLPLMDWSSARELEK